MKLPQGPTVFIETAFLEPATFCNGALLPLAASKAELAHSRCVYSGSSFDASVCVVSIGEELFALRAELASFIAAPSVIHVSQRFCRARRHVCRRRCFPV